MSDVVVARNEHVKLERDSHSFQRLINSSFYDDVSEEQKSRLDSELQDIQNQREAKKKELNDLVFRLRDMDFWPALPRPEGSLLTQEHQLTIRENINDLKRSVQELHDQLKTLNTPGTSHQGTTAEHPEAPPLKRRRLSVNEKTPPKAPSPDTQKSVTEMEDRLMTLELRISEMENNLVENQSTIYEELDSRMIERLEDMAVPQAKDPTPPSPPAPIPLSPQTLERLKGIEANLDQTGTEIVTIAEEIAELIVRGNTYEREVADLRNENAKLKEKITHVSTYPTKLLRMTDTASPLQLEVVQKQCLESSEKDRAEMKALNAAITAFISQPPASSTIPVEEIIRSLQPTLVNEVRKDLYSVLEDQRKAIHGVIQTRSTELSQPVMHNLAVTMQTVDTITRWMDKVNQSGGLHLNGLAKPPNKLPEK